jgi:CTP:molybdopterin cytidylyltransferase MocA
VDAVRAGGCIPVVVVVGAEADVVVGCLRRDGVHAAVTVVTAPDWAEGMGASLRAGLAAVEQIGPLATAALVMLVDTPDVGPDVVARLRHSAGTDPAVLARAAFAGVPGHPVLLGRDHWRGVAATARGDRGARDYLNRHRVDLVECGDLATGRDIDVPGREGPGPPG